MKQRSLLWLSLVLLFLLGQAVPLRLHAEETKKKLTISFTKAGDEANSQRYLVDGLMTDYTDALSTTVEFVGETVTVKVNVNSEDPNVAYLIEYVSVSPGNLTIEDADAVDLANLPQSKVYTIKLTGLEGDRTLDLRMVKMVKVRFDILSNGKADDGGKMSVSNIKAMNRNYPALKPSSHIFVPAGKSIKYTYTSDLKDILKDEWFTKPFKDAAYTTVPQHVESHATATNTVDWDTAVSTPTDLRLSLTRPETKAITVKLNDTDVLSYPGRSLYITDGTNEYPITAATSSVSLSVGKKYEVKMDYTGVGDLFSNHYSGFALKVNEKDVAGKSFEMKGETSSLEINYKKPENTYALRFNVADHAALSITVSQGGKDYTWSPSYDGLKLNYVNLPKDAEGIEVEVEVNGVTGMQPRLTYGGEEIKFTKFGDIYSYTLEGKLSSDRTYSLKLVPTVSTMVSLQFDNAVVKKDDKNVKSDARIVKASYTAAGVTKELSISSLPSSVFSVPKDALLSFEFVGNAGHTAKGYLYRYEDGSVVNTGPQVNGTDISNFKLEKPVNKFFLVTEETDETHTVTIESPSKPTAFVGGEYVSSNVNLHSYKVKHGAMISFKLAPVSGKVNYLKVSADKAFLLDDGAFAYDQPITGDKSFTHEVKAPAKILFSSEPAYASLHVSSVKLGALSLSFKDAKGKYVDKQYLASGTSVTLPVGFSASISPSVDEEYELSGMKVDGAVVTLESHDVILNKDVKVELTLKKKASLTYHTVSFEAETASDNVYIYRQGTDDSMIQVSSGSKLPEGTTIFVYAIAGTDRSFLKWKSGLTSNPTELTVNRDLEDVALFISGTSKPNPDLPGKPIAPPVTPPTGEKVNVYFQFDAWRGSLKVNDELLTAPGSRVFAKNAKLKIVFVPEATATPGEVNFVSLWTSDNAKATANKNAIQAANLIQAQEITLTASEDFNLNAHLLKGSIATFKIDLESVKQLDYIEDGDQLKFADRFGDFFFTIDGVKVQKPLVMGEMKVYYASSQQLAVSARMKNGWYTSSIEGPKGEVSGVEKDLTLPAKTYGANPVFTAFIARKANGEGSYFILHQKFHKFGGINDLKVEYWEYGNPDKKYKEGDAVPYGTKLICSATASNTGIIATLERKGKPTSELFYPNGTLPHLIDAPFRYNFYKTEQSGNTESTFSFKINNAEQFKGASILAYDKTNAKVLTSGDKVKIGTIVEIKAVLPEEFQVARWWINGNDSIPSATSPNPNLIVMKADRYANEIVLYLKERVSSKDFRISVSSNEHGYGKLTITSGDKIANYPTAKMNKLSYGVDVYKTDKFIFQPVANEGCVLEEMLINGVKVSGEQLKEYKADAIDKNYRIHLTFRKIEEGIVSFAARDNAVALSAHLEKADGTKIDLSKPTALVVGTRIVLRSAPKEGYNGGTSGIHPLWKVGGTVLKNSAGTAPIRDRDIVWIVRPGANKITVEYWPNTPNAAEDVAESSVRIYPNPVHEAATLLVPANCIGKEAVVIGMNGSIVRRFFITETETRFDAKDIPAGIYVLLVGKDRLKFIVR